LNNNLVISKYTIGKIAKGDLKQSSKKGLKMRMPKESQ
jgi:hypothetical protein